MVLISVNWYLCQMVGLPTLARLATSSMVKSLDDHIGIEPPG
jgi:hypothetical protein